MNQSDLRSKGRFTVVLTLSVLLSTVIHTSVFAQTPNLTSCRACFDEFRKSVAHLSVSINKGKLRVLNQGGGSAIFVNRDACVLTCYHLLGGLKPNDASMRLDSVHLDTARYPYSSLMDSDSSDFLLLKCKKQPPIQVKCASLVDTLVAKGTWGVMVGFYNYTKGTAVRYNGICKVVTVYEELRADLLKKPVQAYDVRVTSESLGIRFASGMSGTPIALYATLPARSEVFAICSMAPIAFSPINPKMNGFLVTAISTSEYYEDILNKTGMCE